MIPDLPTDRRANTPAVSHVLTIGITTLLIIGLLAATGGFVDSTERQNTRSDLKTIGNNLANELSRVDTLAQYGGNVSVVTEQPETVTAGPYSVRLEKVPSPACPSTGNACLILESFETDVQVTVPIHNESNLLFEEVAPGSYRIRALESGSSATVGGRDLTDRSDLSLLVGVGSSLQDDPLGGELTSVNFPPSPRFTVEPAPPTINETVVLNASASRDPDGNITQYEWDIDADGTYTKSGKRVTHTFEEPGTHQIRLRVQDSGDTPASAARTINVSVSALLYEGDLAKSGNQLTFAFRNAWSESIRIRHVFLNLQDDGVDRLSSPQPEVKLDTDGDGTPDRELDYAHPYPGGPNIPDPGIYLQVDQDLRDPNTTSGPPPRVAPGHRVFVTLQDLGSADTQNELTHVGLSYLHQGTLRETFRADVVNRPYIEDLNVTANGDQAVAYIRAREPLNSYSISYDGVDSGTADESSGENVTGANPPYVYRVNLTSGYSGVIDATLTQANGGTEAVGIPSNGSTVIFDDGPHPSWATASDWGDLQGSLAIANETYGDHPGDPLTLGYPRRDATGSNLVAYWPMDSTAGNLMVDESGNGHVSSTMAAVSDRSLGLFGTTSYGFLKPTSEVTVDSTNKLSGGDSKRLTVSTWYRPVGNVSSGAGGGLVTKHGTAPGDAGGWGLVLYESCPPAASGCSGADVPAVGYTASNGSHDYVLLSDPIPPGTGNLWHHVTVTVKGPANNVKLYHDGELEAVDSSAPDAATANTTHRVRFGVDPTTGNDFNGYIDETRIYSRALSADEVDDHLLLKEPTRVSGSLSGNLTTDVESFGAPHGTTDLNLSADVELNGGRVEVHVVSDNGDRSDSIVLRDGAHTYNVTGMPPADQFHLEVDVVSPSDVNSPAIRTLVLHPDS